MHRVDFDIGTQACSYSVLIGERMEYFCEALISEVCGHKVLILSDSGAAEAALESVLTLFSDHHIECEVHIIDSGETAKSFDSLQAVLSRLIAGNFTRNDMIVNLGGGVVGDVGGFAAAVYMRGISYINIPSTLLSMIDSAVGGKTGIDFLDIKNAVGAFHHPRLVICACELLKSLPDRELNSGFGEALKYYCIGGSSLIKASILERRVTPAFIEECCRIKQEHVLADTHDHGRRRLLNLGHTFGHAFETASGFSLTHGEAVAMGLAASARFGEMLGITESGVFKHIADLISSLGMSCDYSVYAIPAAAFLSHDKKSDSCSIEMAFISRFGEPFLKRVPIELASSFLLDSAKL